MGLLYASFSFFYIYIYIYIYCFGWGLNLFINRGFEKIKISRICPIVHALYFSFTDYLKQKRKKKENPKQTIFIYFYNKSMYSIIINIECLGCVWVQVQSLGLLGWFRISPNPPNLEFNLIFFFYFFL